MPDQPSDKSRRSTERERIPMVEESRRRLAVLAEASALLGASLDYKTTLANVARLLVCNLADWCMISLVADDGTLHWLAAAHVNQAKEALLRELQRSYPIDLNAPVGVARVLRTGQTEIFPTLPEAALIAMAQDERHLAILRELATVSSVSAALRAHGRTLGTITLGMAESGRHYGSDDLELVEELARRTALAMDNARLYDVTQAAARHAEETLAVLDTLLATAPVGLGFWDCDLRYVRLNEAMAAITGRSISAHLGRTIHEMSPDLGAQMAADLQRALATGEPIVDQEVRVPARAAPGHERHWLASYYPVRTPDGTVLGVGGVLVEITARKQLEAQLLHAQKMESIGRLAGGIAHDFNNLLTAIIGYADLAQAELATTDPIHNDLDEIRKVTQRATELTRQLLAFARKQIIAPRICDLNALILDLNKLLQRLIGEDVTLVTRPDPALWRVKVDPGQIEQVLTNLVVNARDAMPGGGTLIVETANMTLDAHYARHHPDARAGEYVLLAVSDTGGGMTPEVQARAFEPFFTTKEQGTGSGLGLAICYGIVKQHRGNIWIYSELGQGTTVKVYLPRAVDAPVVLQSAPAATTQLPTGHETVLIAEDEEAVRQLAVRVLRSLGYTVLEARDGIAALRTAAANAPPVIDLLVTDLVMPQMSGQVLAERLRERYPDMKVLFSTGYTGSMIVHHMRIDAGMVLLTKPFSPADLARKVRELLDSQAAS